MSTTVLQLLKSMKEELDQINFANIPVKLNGRPIDLEIKFNMSPDGYVWYSFLNDYSDYCGGYLQNVSAICYFGCGLYFGGKKRAPKSICVDIEKY